MTKTTILAIDDDAGVRELAQEVFERAGYRAIVSPDVAAGRRVLSAGGVDLLLLGDETQPLAAESFVRAARSLVAARLPILLWTTRSRATERAQAVGADGVIEKPTNLHALLTRVRQAMASATSRRASADPSRRPTAPAPTLAP